MTIQTINIGTTPNDGTGDPARTCFSKINANFTDSANAASKLVATNAEAIAGTAGVLPDAAGVHAVFNQYGYGSVNPQNLTLGCNDIPIGSRYSWDGITEDTAVSLNLPALGGSSSYPRAWNVECYGISTTRIVQEATEVFGVGTINGRKFSRVKHDSTWHPWREIYHTGNAVGTVSQSGGVPTGAIIQRGSNANGEFVRFADGTQICALYYTGIASQSAVAGSFYATATDLNWIFPVEFISIPVVAGNIGRTDASVGYYGYASLKNSSISQVSYRALTPSSSTSVGLQFNLTAIGRWY